ncbi:MAG: hypothetical protein HPY66_3060 [Firmicutes bacterium]|nr:hypothetical protein [Bacillota bacterium]MDI6707337.1 outer spore coat protein CotE [Bacillota bacterium]
MEEDIMMSADAGRVRTIITNAVYGSATQICNTTIYISPVDNKKPAQILGCTVKDAQIKECSFEEIGDNKVNVRVNGMFEVHVWYEANGDTFVAKTNGKFSDVIPVECLGGESYRNKQILAWISQKPISLGTMIVSKSGSPAVSVQVEYGLGVEVIGEAMLNVLAYKLDNELIKKDEEVITNSLTMFNVDADSEDED